MSVFSPFSPSDGFSSGDVFFSLMNGMATANETAADIRTPARMVSVIPLGAMASTDIMLPGDAGATNPAPVRE